MTDRKCLNPDCDRRVPTIGVCVTCADGSYKPKVEGVDIDGTGEPLDIELV